LEAAGRSVGAATEILGIAATSNAIANNMATPICPGDRKMLFPAIEDSFPNLLRDGLRTDEMLPRTGKKW
jgi:hypothetical protein